MIDQEVERRVSEQMGSNADGMVCKKWVRAGEEWGDWEREGRRGRDSDDRRGRRNSDSDGRRGRRDSDSDGRRGRRDSDSDGRRGDREWQNEEWRNEEWSNEMDGQWNADGTAAEWGNHHFEGDISTPSMCAWDQIMAPEGGCMPCPPMTYASENGMQCVGN